MKTSSSRPAFLLIALGMVASCGILVKAKSDPENRDLVTTNTSSKDAEPSGESSEPPPAQNAPDGRSDYSLCKAINDADHSLPTASGNSKFAHDPKTDYIFNPTFSAMSDLFAQGKLIDANLAGRITKLISATYDYFELQPLWNPGNLYLPGKGRYPWLTMFPADAAEIQGWIRPTPNVSLLKTLERTIYLAGGDLDLRAAGTIKDCIIVAKGNVIATRAEFCTIIAGGNISIGTSVSSVGVSSGVIKTELMDNEGHPSNFARGFYISSESKISFQVPENAERFTVQSNGGVFERISTIAFSPYSTRYDVPEAIALRKQYVIEYTAEGHGSSRRINERYPNELRIRYEYRPVDLSQSEDFRISFPDSSIIEFGASNMTIKRYDRNSTEISVHNIQHHKNLVSHLQYDSGVSWISTFARLDRKEVEDDKQLGDQVKLLFDDTHDSCQAAIEHNSDELFLKGKCGGKILNYHAKISDWKVAGKVRAFYQLFKKTKGVVTSCSNVNNEIFQFLNVKPQNGGGFPDLEIALLVETQVKDFRQLCKNLIDCGIEVELPLRYLAEMALSVGSAFLDSSISPFETRIRGARIQLVPSETYKTFTTGYRPIRDQFFRGLSESMTSATYKLLVNFMIDKGLILESHRAKLETPFQKLLEIEEKKLSFQDYKLRLKEKPGYSELLGYYSGINQLERFESIMSVLHTFYIYSENISNEIRAGSRMARIENLNSPPPYKRWIFDVKIEEQVVDDSLRFYIDANAPGFVSEFYLNELIHLGILPAGTTTIDLQTQ